MAADVLVKEAWYVAGLSREFATQQLVGQLIAEKPLVLWRTTAGQVVAFDFGLAKETSAVEFREGL